MRFASRHMQQYPCWSFRSPIPSLPVTQGAEANTKCGGKGRLRHPDLFPDGFHIDGLWRMHDRLTWLTCRVLDCFYQSLFDTRR